MKPASPPLWPFLSLSTPIGWLQISGHDRGVTAIAFCDDDPGSSGESLPVLEDARAQLKAYFSGQRETFDLPLAPDGTDFRRAVWNVLVGIPFGQTQTYGEIASLLQNEKAVRAVGAANGQNPVAIVVPCHRVIGANGKLTGYAGALWRKKWLLEHEAGFRYGKQQSLF